MKITGTYTIDAPQDQVWAALNDIDVLARIVPGCERLEQTGENEFRGTVKIGIQTIKGTYDGRIRLEDIQPPRHYRLVAHGKSANGVVDGSGTVDLAEQDGQTLLTYAGDAQIGGTLASVGQRLIEGAARQLINQSLKALVEQINARAARASGGGDAETEEPTEDSPTASSDTAMPWPFPGSTHPAITSEPRSLDSSEQAPSSAETEQPTEDSPTASSDRAMPWPFPGSTHPALTSEPRSLDSSEQAPPGAQAGQPSQDSPTASGDRAMPWPFPGSTHPALTSEPRSSDSSAQAPLGAQAPSSQPSEQPRPAFAPRTVVVPEHEQLKPETIMRGIAADALKERPWLPWVVVAFLLGYILGRLRR